MRKLAIMAALATSALTAPALARDGAWYVGAEGGAMIVEDIHYDTALVGNAANLDSKYGYDVDGIVGYDFGMLRVEGEVGYKRAHTDQFTTQTGSRAAGTLPLTVCLPAIMNSPGAGLPR